MPLWLIYGITPPPSPLPLSEVTPGVPLNCYFPCCVDADGNDEAGVSSPGCRLFVGGWTPEHPRMLILPGQCVPPNIVRHS